MRYKKTIIGITILMMVLLAGCTQQEIDEARIESVRYEAHCREECRSLGLSLQGTTETSNMLYCECIQVINQPKAGVTPNGTN